MEASAAERGELHIRHMYENYRKLEHLYAYAGVQICPCELDEEKCALAFPFVEGKVWKRAFPVMEKKKILHR